MPCWLQKGLGGLVGIAGMEKVAVGVGRVEVVLAANGDWREKCAPVSRRRRVVRRAIVAPFLSGTGTTAGSSQKFSAGLPVPFVRGAD